MQLPTIIYGASGAGYYCDAIVSAGSQGNPNGTHCNAWLGTLGNKENTAWFVNCFANGYITFQDDVIKTIAPTFNLDLSKVEIKGDEIIKKAQAAYSPVEQDDNCQEHQLLGKIYKFAGYNWTACELMGHGQALKWKNLEEMLTPFIQQILLVKILVPTMIRCRRSMMT